MKMIELEMREIGLSLMKKYPPKVVPPPRNPNGRPPGIPNPNAGKKPLSEEKLTQMALALMADGPGDDRKAWSRKIYALRHRMEMRGVDTSMLPKKKTFESQLP